MRKMARHAISQRLYLQMIMYIVDSEYAQYILSLHMAGLCYKQPLTYCIYTPCEYSFVRKRIYATTCYLNPSEKDCFSR